MIEIALSLVVKVPCAVITGMLMFAHFLWFVRGNYPFLQGRLLIFLLFFLGLPRPKYVIEATKCWLVGKPVSFVPTEDIKGLLQCAVGKKKIKMSYTCKAIAHFRVFTLLKTGPEFGRESEASCDVRLGGAKIKRDRWFFYP